jgi:hypothetical protein
MIDKIETWIGAAVGIFISFFKLYEWWKKRKEKKNENTLRKFAEGTEELQTLIDSVVKNGYCPRVYLFRGHNGGDRPKLGSPYYVDVAYSKHDDLLKDKSSRYKEIEVDSTYRKMLLELIQKEKIEIDPITLEDGLLKDIYIDEKIVFSKVYKIYTGEKNFFFLSCAWYKPITATERLECNLLANKLKILYKKHYN